MKPRIFVSCGQCTEAEKQLGEDICTLIGRMQPGYEAYFAEQQSTVEGVSDHILKALYKAAGFICVMHNRGDIRTEGHQIRTRGSVWIEQEIAIVTLMRNVLGRKIPILFYKQVGVGREGIRDVLLLNPNEFTTEAEVLAHLKKALPSVKFNPYAEYELDILVEQRDEGFRQNGIQKSSFRVNVKNVGEKRIKDFLLRVYFPTPFLNPHSHYVAVSRQHSTDSHMCFVADQNRIAGEILNPGDALESPLRIQYFVSEQLLRDSDAMNSEIRIELLSDLMISVKTKELRIGDYHKI